MIRAGFAPTSAMSAKSTCVGLAVQRIPEELDLAGRDDDEHRLALRDPLADERRDAVDEALVARVEERLVRELLGGT